MFKLKFTIFTCFILFFSTCSSLVERGYSSNDPEVIFIENWAGIEYYRLECASKIIERCPRINIEPLQLPRKTDYINVEKLEDLVKVFEESLLLLTHKNIRVERMVLEGNEIAIIYSVLEGNTLKKVMFQKGMTVVTFSFIVREEVYKDYEPVFDRFWKRYMKLNYE